MSKSTLEMSHQEWLEDRKEEASEVRMLEQF